MSEPRICEWTKIGNSAVRFDTITRVTADADHATVSFDDGKTWQTTSSGLPEDHADIRRLRDRLLANLTDSPPPASAPAASLPRPAGGTFMANAMAADWPGHLLHPWLDEATHAYRRASGDKGPIHDWLGMTEREWALVAASPSELAAIVAARRASLAPPDETPAETFRILAPSFVSPPDHPLDRPVAENVRKGLAMLTEIREVVRLLPVPADRRLEVLAMLETMREQIEGAVGSADSPAQAAPTSLQTLASTAHRLCLELAGVLATAEALRDGLAGEAMGSDEDGGQEGGGR